MSILALKLVVFFISLFPMAVERLFSVILGLSLRWLICMQSLVLPFFP